MNLIAERRFTLTNAPDFTFDCSRSYITAGELNDSVTGLYVFGSRYYDPSIGRFVTQDSYAGILSDPSSLNCYVYAQDNPLSFTDPTGHDIWRGIFEGLGYRVNAFEPSVEAKALSENGDWSLTEMENANWISSLKQANIPIWDIGPVEAEPNAIDHPSYLPIEIPNLAMYPNWIASWGAFVPRE
jgi:RHS repeat-associated protein